MIRTVFIAPILGLVLIFVASLAVAEVKLKEVTSPGGFNAWLVENHSIPFVALELRFKGGASLDAEGKRGATNLMTGLLEEGAGDLDARAFARALPGLRTLSLQPAPGVGRGGPPGELRDAQPLHSHRGAERPHCRTLRAPRARPWIWQLCGHQHLCLARHRPPRDARRHGPGRAGQ